MDKQEVFGLAAILEQWPASRGPLIIQLHDVMAQKNISIKLTGTEIRDADAFGLSLKAALCSLANMSQ